jgi:hypothetical protein
MVAERRKFRVVSCCGWAAVGQNTGEHQAALNFLLPISLPCWRVIFKLRVLFAGNRLLKF